jgi:acyl-CoA thioester hydrolase
MHLPQTEGVVRPDWIDSNGHLNLAYYVVMFDQATDAMYEALDIGQAYREGTGNSCFTAETHTIYERELRLGERVRITSHLLAVDAKRMLYFHEMFHAEQGHRCAAQELIALHVDLQVRKTAPWPAEVLARLQDGVRAREGMQMPEGVGRRITMPTPK